MCVRASQSSRFSFSRGAFNHLEFVLPVKRQLPVEAAAPRQLNVLPEFDPLSHFYSCCYCLAFFRGSFCKPVTQLSLIRNLADLDIDGKMDRLEFSIAMKLIKLKLQGRSLPPSLPLVMKQSPGSGSAVNIPISARFGNKKKYIFIINSFTSALSHPKLWRTSVFRKIG